MPEIVKATALPRGGESFILVGGAGSGKTSQGLTLPRPTLFIFFDPNGPASVRGFPGVDTVCFFPGETGIVLAGKGRSAKATAATAFTPTVYTDFVAWFNQAAKENLFASYKSVVLDTTTWLEASISEYVLHEMNMFGQAPDKHVYEKIRLNSVASLGGMARHLRSQNVIFLINVHLKDKTNQGGEIIGQDLLLTGQGRQLVPTLVDNIFSVEYVMGKGPEFKTGAKFVGYTRPHSLFKLGRSSLKKRVLPYELDLTIPDWEHPERYGLGKIIAEIHAGAHDMMAELDEEGEVIPGTEEVA